MTDLIDDPKDFMEEWENVAPMTNYIVHLDARGDEKPEAIQGVRKFRITTYEREVTQDKVRDPKLDPFKNGCFRPVKVPSGITFQSNPNALSDEDIRTFFRASDMAWKEYFEPIDSPATLGRMLEVATAMMNEGIDLSALRVRSVREKLDVVKPKTRITQKDREQYEKLATVPTG